jgi:hypothetical protein
MTPEEALAKRITVFPHSEFMSDADIKRNVYAAMRDYAKEVLKHGLTLASEEATVDYWMDGHTCIHYVEKDSILNLEKQIITELKL